MTPKFLYRKVNINPKILIFIQDAIFTPMLFAPHIFYYFFNFHLFLNLFYDLLFFILCIISLISIYGAFIEPYVVITKHINFNIKNLNGKIRIVFFSDLHIGPFKKSSFINRIKDTINKLNPDFILIGGDFITGRYETFKYLKPLKILGAKYPTFAVIGNHDYNMDLPFEKPCYNLANNLVDYLKVLNITALRNCSVQLKIKDNILNIVGIDDLWSGKINIEKAFSKINNEYPIITLSHNPDTVKSIKNNRTDLILAGHTHGNTFRFFKIPLFPFIRNIKLPAKYLKGYQNYNNNFIYITSGVGECFTRMRFIGNFPEIIVLDLK